MAPRYPSIPEPTLSPESLRDAVLTIKQAFELLTGQRGNPNYAAITGETFPDLAGPWKIYGPLITPSSGVFTAASVAGRFRTIGKTTFISLDISITTAGTAGGLINVTLPNTAGTYCVLVGREINVSGLMQQFTINPGQAFGTLLKYDNSSSIGNGFRIIVSGVYESV